MTSRARSPAPLFRFALALAFTAGFSASLPAQFLVRDQEYRCPPSDHTCKSPHNLSSFETHTTEKGNSYSINFVEFQRQGRTMESHRTRRRAGTGTECARNGWQAGRASGFLHSRLAEQCDETSGSCQDVCRFRDILLKELADSESQNGRPLRVVGIYLGWRGLTFTVEPFKHIVSYWPRRGVARHVGQTGMFDAVKQIEGVVGESRKNYVVP